MDEANDQIEATKRILGLRNPIALLLVLFDRIPGIIPGVVADRVQRCFAMDGADKVYEHIDFVSTA
jgi:hypothetical protein